MKTLFLAIALLLVCSSVLAEEPIDEAGVKPITLFVGGHEMLLAPHQGPVYKD